MNGEATVESGLSVGNIKNIPSYPGALQMMKQWICYPLSALAALCWYSLRGSQGLDANKTLWKGLALSNITDSCIEGTPL